MPCSVAQSYLTLCNSRDCSSRGSSVHGILQARILEWVTMPFSLLMLLASKTNPPPNISSSLSSPPSSFHFLSPKSCQHETVDFWPVDRVWKRFLSDPLFIKSQTHFVWCCHLTASLPDSWHLLWRFFFAFSPHFYSWIIYEQSYPLCSSPHSLTPPSIY